MSRCAAAGLLLATTLAAGPALAQEPDQPPGPSSPVQVVHRPSAAEMERIYPAGATRRGISGKAVISCVVQASTVPQACEVLSESPEGLGFGDAGLVAVALMRLRPAFRDGAPVIGGRIHIPISFRMAEPTARRPGTAQLAPIEETPADSSGDSAPAAPAAPRRAPAPERAPRSLWVVAAFAAIVLGGMPVMLLWDGRRRRGRA